MITEIITHPLAMLLCGLATHFLKDLARLAKEGNRLSLREYWMLHPYQSWICFIGSIAGYAALGETGQLSAITAFGVGYMANSVADVMGKRTAEKM